jgi:OmpA-OmpF porin, OOP family
MRNRFLLGAGVALAVALSWADARAQLFAMPAGPGAWYFGGEGGWTSLENESGSAGGVSFRQNFSDGFNIGARAGYEWGPLRVEEEFSFRQNGISSVNVGGVNFNTNGNRNTYAFMTNLIYDFTLGWPFSPHIGGGIGAV